MAKLECAKKSSCFCRYGGLPRPQKLSCLSLSAFFVHLSLSLYVPLLICLSMPVCLVLSVFLLFLLLFLFLEIDWTPSF